MSKSSEAKVNTIREKLFSIVQVVADYQSLAGKDGAPELDPVAEGLEEVIVEFERLVNEIPVEVRS